MKDIVVVSASGQITLPATMRRLLGIRNGGLLIIEDRDGEIVLRKAAGMKFDKYNIYEIAEWNREDWIDPSVGKRILKKRSR